MSKSDHYFRFYNPSFIAERKQGEKWGWGAGESGGGILFIYKMIKWKWIKEYEKIECILKIKTK